MNPSVTLSVSIACAPEIVAAFVADPRNPPQWAGGFCKSIRQDDDRWVLDTGVGEVGLRFSDPTEPGILKQVVTLDPDLQVFVPLIAHRPTPVAAADLRCMAREIDKLSLNGSGRPIRRR